MYVVYINLLYFLSIFFLFTYNKNLLFPQKINSSVFQFTDYFKRATLYVEQI